MRLINLENIKPEHRLAKNIYDENGNILLAQGAAVQPAYIERLRKIGFISVYIEDELTSELEVNEVVSEALRVQVKKITKSALQKIKAGKSLEAKQIRQAINDIMDEVIRNRQLLVHLTEIRSKGDHPFSHSVSVCILSLLTAVAMEYDQFKLKELGVGALLHDVGKAMLPESLVNSQKKLNPTEKETLKKHTDYGFDILRKTDNISAVAAHVAWQHHENFDGTGYPRGIKGKDIHEYGRIVAVANFYDNLSTDAPGRKRLLPHEIIEILRECEGKEFDPEISKTFIKNIAPFPVGSIVILNTGEKGIVVSVKKDFPTRPTVRLITDASGTRLNGENQFRNLLEELTVFVTEVEKE